MEVDFTQKQGKNIQPRCLIGVQRPGLAAVSLSGRLPIDCQNESIYELAILSAYSSV